MTLPPVVLFAVCIALAFDVVNGFHDSANSIATLVATKVVSPRVAVLWAALFNFLAMFLFKAKVAGTISKIVIIDPHDNAFIYVVLAGLIGAIAWNLVTWWLGLPSSSSHALIGALAGAGIAYRGLDIIYWQRLIETVEFIAIAPLMGMVLGYVGMILSSRLVRRWTEARVDRLFRRSQLISAAAYSLGHGGNDAQKTMGVIVALLVASGKQRVNDTHISWWIVLSCHAAMALGTSLGGWRIVETLGTKLTKLQPMGGFCAEIAGALTLFGSTVAGIPISTTHTIAGGIVGVGSTRRLSAVNWSTAKSIVWAWMLTIPLAAAVGAGLFCVFHAAMGGR